jgi:hypothetical protein
MRNWTANDWITLSAVLVVLASAGFGLNLGISLMLAVTKGHRSELAFGFITYHRLMSQTSLSVLEKVWMIINILAAAIVNVTVKRKSPVAVRYCELLLAIALTWHALSFDMTSSVAANYIILVGSIYLLGGAMAEVHGHALQTWRRSSLAYVLTGKKANG